MANVKNFQDASPEKPGLLPRDVKHTVWIGIIAVATVLVTAIVASAATGSGGAIIDLVLNQLAAAVLLFVALAGAYAFGVFHSTIIDVRKRRAEQPQEKAATIGPGTDTAPVSLAPVIEDSTTILPPTPVPVPNKTIASVPKPAIVAAPPAPPTG